MIERLEELSARHGEITEKLNTDLSQNERRDLMIEYNRLCPIIETYEAYKKAVRALNDGEDMLAEADDDEMRKLIKEDIFENKELAEQFSRELAALLRPRDKNDDKNVIVEIRGGAGGDEAALFAGDLFRMYMRYAERRRWKTDVMSVSEGSVGGLKEIIFSINGNSAYERLKYESGVHRVQRIPVTESGGRIHTSTVTVAVLPEAEEVDITINPNDIRVDVFRSSGNGGQSVNTTDSAVRITHTPTGIVVSCQDEKSQLKNKDRAMKILRARLYDLELEKSRAALSAERKSQVGTGNRNERIRTYNFPQGRVTDHRVGFTLHRIDAVLDGELDEIMDVLATEIAAGAE